MLSQYRKYGGASSAQATIEFVFGMIGALLLLMGMIQVAVWSGRDLVARRKAHEDLIISNIDGIRQMNPNFYYSTPMFASVESNVFGD